MKRTIPFGLLLGVLDAMWKGPAMIVENVGGIRHQTQMVSMAFPFHRSKMRGEDRAVDQRQEASTPIGAESKGNGRKTLFAHTLLGTIS